MSGDSLKASRVSSEALTHTVSDVSINYNCIESQPYLQNVQKILIF